jgi:type II secretory pathway pseudopilin PulG
VIAYLPTWFTVLPVETQIAAAALVVSVISIVCGALAGFLSGRSAARVQAVAQTEAARQEQLAAERFAVYMRLLDLSNRYFWETTPRGADSVEDYAIENRAECFRLTWEIAEGIRKFDDIPESERLLEVLFSEGAFDSNSARHAAMNSILKDMGAALSPRFTRALQAISQQNNQHRLATGDFGGRNNGAPASFSSLNVRMRVAEIKARRHDSAPE